MDPTVAKRQLQDAIPAPSAEASRADPEGDAGLVTRCLNGEEEAWLQLVARYDRLVFSVIRKFNLPEAQSGEIFNDVFTELWRDLDRLENPRYVGSWLATVTYRLCLSQARAQRRLVSIDRDGDEAPRELAAASPNGDALLLAAEREQQVREALAALSPRCRQLFEWLFYTDPPPAYDEVARRLGISANSVGFVRGRCLKTLRRQLEARTGQARASSAGK